MPVAELRVPRDPVYVGLVRLVVAQAARLAGVPQDRVEDVKIAVAEALANATRDVGPDDRHMPIELRFGRGSGGFEVVVLGVWQPSSTGEHANGSGAEPLDPKLSFTLIEGLTDEFSHESHGDVMRLRFVVGVT